jgi:sortase (surface protein transpeptidase)
MGGGEPGQRLVLSTVMGVVAGLVAWGVLEGDEAVRELPPRVASGVGTLEKSGVSEGRDEDGRADEGRDHRPPHAPRVPATPPRIEIPAIGVRAHVLPLGTTATGALAVPRNWSVVGRWKGGSRPGRAGAAVLVGHVDSQTRPAVFHRLSELRSGDLIRYVGRSGKPVRFIVVRKERASKANFPTSRVYLETQEPALRLITCGGSFDWSRGHYRDNMIVYATRI